MHRLARSFFRFPKRTSRKFRLDTNQRKIHTPGLRGAVAACRFHVEDNAKPTKSKARQWRAVMPVETGETQSVARSNFPEIRPQVKRKKHSFRNGLFCADFWPFRADCFAITRRTPMQKHPLIKPTDNYGSNAAPLSKDGTLETLEGRRKKSFGTKHVSACMPLIADLRDGTTYAAWPVWSGSTTKDTRFVPMPKKAVIRIYHKAIGWIRLGKVAGRHGGLIGLVRRFLIQPYFCPFQRLPEPLLRSGLQRVVDYIDFSFAPLYLSRDAFRWKRIPPGMHSESRGLLGLSVPSPSP